MKNKTLIGVSGDEGSFSEEAAMLYAKRMDITPSLVYLIDMEGVLAALSAGKIAIGIFPVVNLQGGLVHMAFEAMGKYSFRLIDEVWLEVHQCLMTKKGILPEKIKKIVSHSQALKQCAHYLKTHFKEAELIEWQDTAKAARDLSEGQLSDCTAIIAPERAGGVYNLAVMAKNIEDRQPNLTAFIVVKKY